MKGKIFKNINWLFADKILRVIGELLVGIWVARYLGSADFGILSYAIAFSSFAIFISNLGLDHVLVRELTKYPEKYNTLLGTACFLKLVGGIGAVVLIAVAIFFVKTNNWMIQVVVVISALRYIFHSFDVIDYFYQSKILSKYVVYGRDSAYLLASFAKIALILIELPLIYFVWLYVLEFVVAAFILVLIYQRRNKSIFSWKVDLKLAKQLMSYSWPLMFSTMLITIHTNIDQVMIGHYFTESEVGVYSVAVRLAQFWYFIPTIIVATLTPYFVRLREEDSVKYDQHLIGLYSVMFWMGVIVGVVTILFGQEFIVLLYGAEYQDAYQALVYNIWSGIFVSQAVARGIWLISENLQKYRLYNNIFSVIVNILGNMLLIPMLGISGAAVATLLTQMSGTWIFAFVFKPLRLSTWCLIKSANPAYLFKKDYRITEIR